MVVTIKVPDGTILLEGDDVLVFTPMENSSDHYGIRLGPAVMKKLNETFTSAKLPKTKKGGE